MRPWTRASLSNMLEDTEGNIEDAGEGPVADEARKLYQALTRELDRDSGATCVGHVGVRIDSIYTVARAISGAPLHDSFHLGSTIVNDYGRPYENGFNNYSGLSGYVSHGRFVLYARGEFQEAPSATGYSAALGQALSAVDGTTYAMPNGSPYLQVTLPQGTIASASQGRFLEAYVSMQVLNHVISFGKQDEWLGPGMGGSFAYSNNAGNIYAFHINRMEPLSIPLLSALTGSFRYEFLVGALHGHTLMPNPSYTPGSATEANVINPGNPWIHLEKISFRPTANLEFGFERTGFFGGKGHSPVTLHTFLKSFASVSSPSAMVKNGRDDPGARFASFDFSYNLPFLRNWVTLYGDGEVHDDVSPIDAPRRASWRPGIYLARVPGAPKLDLRLEVVTTDPPSTTKVITAPVPSPPLAPTETNSGGRFMYWEQIERQGYTNEGQIFGDWIGRESKGGQAWISYHLSGDEWIQVALRNQKSAKNFIPGSTAIATNSGVTTLIPGGTTLNDLGVEFEKRIGKNLAINARFIAEQWNAPIYLPGQQTVTTTSIQMKWYPDRKLGFRD